MSRTLFGLLTAGLLLVTVPAAARTLVVNANGYTFDSRGELIRFDRLQIGDDGRVEATYKPGDSLPKGLVLTRQVEAGGRTLIPGLIDAHADVMGLGLAALAERTMPPPGPRREEMALAAALRTLGSMGVTMVHDQGTRPDAWTLYRRFGDEGRLSARIYAVAADPEALARIAPLRPTPWLYQDRLVLRAVRFFADGPLADRKAALRAPYADDAATSGVLLWNDAQIRNLMSRALMDGFQPSLSATGDAAVRQAVDAYQELAATYGTERRWRLDGILLADPADLARAPDYGIVASLWPGGAIGARDMIAARLGEARLGEVAALRTLADAHTRIALGSGAPAGSPDPFLALHAAVTRQDADAQPAGGWQPGQGIDVRQAFAGFTIGAAYAAFAEDRVGTLEPGKWADFVLLDRDPFAIPTSELWRVQVLTTFLAGEVVFKRGDASAAQQEDGDAVR